MEDGDNESVKSEVDDKLAFHNFRISPETVEQLKIKGVKALFPIQAGMLVAYVFVCISIPPI